MTVAAPPRPVEVLAKRRSTCVLCPDPIEKGDAIRPLAVPKVWVHSLCAQDYEPDDDYFGDNDNDYGVDDAS